MTTQSTIVVAVAGAYLLASLVIGSLPGKKTSETADGYVAGDRALGLLVMYFITGATIFSAFAFLGAPGWAYSKGVAVFYILAFGTLGFLPFYFIGPRASRLGRAFGFVTQAQMVSRRFGMPSIAILMAAISVLAFVPYLAIQMQGAGYVLNAITEGEVHEYVGAAIVYGVVLIYVLRSGVLGVGWTNTFQGIFMMALAWGLGIYLPWKLYGGIGPMFERIATERSDLLVEPGLKSQGGPAWNWSEYSTAVIVSIIGFSFWPHLFMKAFTARDERTLRRTVVLYPTFQIFLVPLMIIGFAGVLFASSPDKPDQILPHILMGLEGVPALVIGLFCAGALAASMSSGDAIVHATASIIVRDGIVSGLQKPLGKHSELRLIRSLLVVVMLASYSLAILYKGSLVALLLYAYGPVVQFAPAVLASLYSRRATGPGVLAGLASGIAANIWFAWLKDARPFEIHAGVYGLFVNVVVLVAVSMLTSSRRAEGEEEFLRIAATREE